MSSVRKSLAFSALDSYVSLLLSIASTMVIARILTPVETGIFAVAAVFAALASTFRDFGVAEYLIQEEQLNDDAIRAALTVNIAISWLMALLLFGLSPLAADFYRSPGIGEVMRVQAVSFLLIPFGAVTMAWFRREMNMKPVFIASLGANLVSFVVSISLALHGFGYMSLAWSSLAGVVVTVSISLFMRPAGFPRWPGLRGIGRVVQFGKFASGIYVFGQLGKGAPEMIIGRAADLASVGLFSRGAGLIEIFHRLVLRAVAPMCLPYFAREVREERTPLRALARAIALLTGVGWPFLACIGLAAYAAVRLIYGSQWLAAVPLAQALCIVAAVELLYYPSKEALLSMGLVRESAQLQISTQILRAAGLLAVIPWGLQGACWGLLAGTIGGAMHSHWALSRYCGLSLRRVVSVAMPSLIAAGCTAAPLVFWQFWRPIDESNYLAASVFAVAICPPCWLVALRTTGHPLWQELARAATAARDRLQRRTAG